MSEDETRLASGRTLLATGLPVAGPSTPQLGELLLERYRLQAELGRGGNAIVYEALDVELQRSVALKVLKPGFGRSDSAGWQQLLEEARMLADVESPGVARLLDALRDGESRYLVMELVRGPELCAVIEALRERRVRAGARPKDGSWLADAADLPHDAPARLELGRLSWDRAVACFGAWLVDAVAGMHDRGLVHGDLKPGNVKLDESGAPVVLDFGLAGRLDQTSHGPVRGTPRYMAPEQLDERRHRLDPRTDVHQLGLILFELLTLQDGHPNLPLSELLARVRNGDTPRVLEADERADPGLAAVIDRATASATEARYQGLPDFADDLRRIARGNAPRHAPTPFRYRLRCGTVTTLRNGWFLSTAAALMLAFVAWHARSAVEPDLTRLEGWRFQPGASSLQPIAPDSIVRVDDDLGVRITSNERTWLYAISIYGGDGPAEQRIAPLYPLRMVDGRPLEREDETWSLTVEPGAHDVLCARLTDPAPQEGLIVFASHQPVSLLERWLAALQTRSTDLGAGVPHDDAFAMLDGLDAPSLTRGRRIDTKAGSDDELRYASLDSARASGREEWDLGSELVRFELICRVAAP